MFICFISPVTGLLFNSSPRSPKQKSSQSWGESITGWFTWQRASNTENLPLSLRHLGLGRGHIRFIAPGLFLSKYIFCYFRGFINIPWCHSDHGVTWPDHLWAIRISPLLLMVQVSKLLRVKLHFLANKVELCWQCIPGKIKCMPQFLRTNINTLIMINTFQYMFYIIHAEITENDSNVIKIWIKIYVVCVPHDSILFLDAGDSNRITVICLDFIPFQPAYLNNRCIRHYWYQPKNGNSHFNSLRPGDAYMRRLTGSSLVQIMACRLFGAKPLS